MVSSPLPMPPAWCRSSLLAALCVLGLLGCGSGSQADVEKPRDLIASDSMKLLMKELIIASEGVKLTWQDTTAAFRDTLTAQAYHGIMAHYGVDKERFLRSYNYYTARPVALDSIYFKLLEDLSEDKATLGEPAFEQQAEEDDASAS